MHSRRSTLDHSARPQRVRPAGRVPATSPPSASAVSGHSRRHTGRGMIVAADPAETSRGVVPSIVRPRGRLRRGTGPSAPASGRSPQVSAGGRHVLLRPPPSSDRCCVVGVRVARRSGHRSPDDDRTVGRAHPPICCTTPSRRLLTAQHPSWTGDVGQLTDIDHAGLRGLLSAYRRALRHGRRITLYSVSPFLQRALTPAAPAPSRAARESTPHPGGIRARLIADLRTAVPGLVGPGRSDPRVCPTSTPGARPRRLTPSGWSGR